MSASASSANREPALRQYLKDLSAIPPMQPGEEAQISARIRAGDKSARTRLIEANLRFVVAFAKKYRNLGLPFQDLINAGNVGMIEAAKRFDPDNGAKFITYAVWWIKQSILQTLSGQNAVFHLPQKQASLQLKLARTTRHLQNALEHHPSAAELAREMHLSEPEVDELLKSRGEEVPIDGLHDGERAAISLACELKADLLLMDEADGRAAALARHLQITGTIGLLQRAAERGLLDLADAFDRIKQTDFWISPRLLDAELARHRAQQGSRKH